DAGPHEVAAGNQALAIRAEPRVENVPVLRDESHAPPRRGLEDAGPAGPARHREPEAVGAHRHVRQVVAVELPQSPAGVRIPYHDALLPVSGQDPPAAAGEDGVQRSRRVPELRGLPAARKLPENGRAV